MTITTEPRTKSKAGVSPGSGAASTPQSGPVFSWPHGFGTRRDKT